jgi:hypothetical protein
LLSFGAESFVIQLAIGKYKYQDIITIILPVLCKYETWSLILREECRLRMFENRVFRRIFGPNRKEVIGECRKLFSQELNNLQCSANIIRVIKSRRM